MIKKCEMEINCKCGWIFRHPFPFGAVSKILRTRVECPQCKEIVNPWTNENFIVPEKEEP